MGEQVKLVNFNLEKQKFALPIQSVDRIIQAVEYTQIPDSPAFLMGFINLHGNLIPLINLRFLFEIEQRELDPDDKIIILNNDESYFALWVDAHVEVNDVDDTKFTDGKEFSFQNKYLKGVVKLESDISVINNPEEFLSTEQLNEITRARETALKNTEN